MEYKIAVAKQLSSLLKNLRKQSGLTQRDLGEQIGISQRMVAKIEAAPEKVSFARILQILSELGTDLLVRERKGKALSAKSSQLESW